MKRVTSLNIFGSSRLSCHLKRSSCCLGDKSTSFAESFAKLGSALVIRRPHEKPTLPEGLRYILVGWIVVYGTDEGLLQRKVAIGG